MKVYFARHGRTNYNDLGLCNADPAVDVHLTPEGVKQSKSLAESLKQVKIKHIFTSELKRAQQTADIVNEFHDLKIEIDPRLNEHRSGFEGKHFEELNAAMNAADNRWTARFNDGESIQDVKERAAGFIADLQAKQYDSVLIVTSEWVIRAMLAIVQNLTYEEAWAVEIIQGKYLEAEI